MTLDDASSLLYPPFEDLLLDHDGPMFKSDAAELMVHFICTYIEEADYDVEWINGGACTF